MENEFASVSWPGWEVVRKLGEGSFGAVYEIRRTLPDGREEACALKKLTVPKSPDEIDELYAQSFGKDSITTYFRSQMSELVSEYSLMQSLGGCPNIVSCHDIRYVQHEDNIGWDIYIRMELLYPLKKALGSSYSEKTTIVLGTQLCNALNACHAENIIHRDIKPENILVSGKGVFKLGDFGVAKISERTGTGTLTGSYGYMAPEVASHRHYGAQADIYSLGMVLYWMMNRRTLPFLPLPPDIPTGVQRQQAQERRLSGAPLPPPADGSEALKRVVLKACAFSPAERYRSAEELRRALIRCTRVPESAPVKQASEGRQTEAPDLPPLMPPSAFEPKFINRTPAAPTVRTGVPRRPAKEEAPAKKEKKKRKSERWIRAALCVLLPCCALLTVWQITYNMHSAKYRQAQQLMDSGEYYAAAEAFEALENYKDSAEKAQEASLLVRYQSAQALLEANAFQEAAEAFDALGDYTDSAERAQEARELLDLQQKGQAYQAAQTLMAEGNYVDAAEAFDVLGDYGNSAEMAQEARLGEAYQSAQSLMDSGKYMQAMWAFSNLDYRDSAEKVQEAKDRFIVSQWVSLSAGDTHTVGLRSDGTVVAVGRNDNGQCDTGNWKDIVDVSTGFIHTVGLRIDGVVVTAGYNGDGQCNTDNWKGIVDVSAGGYHTVGLHGDGTVVAIGREFYGQCEVSGWKDIVAIAAGSYHTVGLQADGTVVAVGDNAYGQCDVSGWENIVAIAAGGFHTVGLRADGTVVAVGYNYDGQCDVFDWKDIAAITAGDFNMVELLGNGYHTVGLRTDGTVVAVGYNYDGQCDVSDWKDIVAIAAGGSHTVGLHTDGTVVAVGNNDYGECNVSGWKNIRLPQA